MNANGKYARDAFHESGDLHQHELKPTNNVTDIIRDVYLGGGTIYSARENQRYLKQKVISQVN